MYKELVKDLREKVELLTAAEPMGIKNADEREECSE